MSTQDENINIANSNGEKEDEEDGEAIAHVTNDATIDTQIHRHQHHQDEVIVIAEYYSLLKEAKAHEFHSKEEETLWTHQYVQLNKPLTKQTSLSATRSSRPHVCLICDDLFHLAAYKILLEAIGCVVQHSSDIVNAPKLVAPMHRSNESPNRFDFVFFEQTKETNPPRNMGDFCQIVRESDRAFQKKTNFIARNVIIAIIGPEQSAKLMIGRGADLFLRRPFAMHMRTLRHVMLPPILWLGRRCRLLSDKKSAYQELKSLFPSAKLVMGKPADLHPDLRTVPVLDDDKDNAEEIAHYKKVAQVQDKRIKALRLEVKAVAMELEDEKTKTIQSGKSFSDSLRNTSAETEKMQKDLQKSRMQVANLQDKLERLETNGKRTSSGSTDAHAEVKETEHLKRRIEHLMGELEKERRNSAHYNDPSRRRSRSGAANDVAVQAGSGVTMAYNSKGTVASQCDIYNVEMFERLRSAKKEAHDAVQRLTAQKDEAEAAAAAATAQYNILLPRRRDTITGAAVGASSGGARGSVADVASSLGTSISQPQLKTEQSDHVFSLEQKVKELESMAEMWQHRSTASQQEVTQSRVEVATLKMKVEEMTELALTDPMWLLRQQRDDAAPTTATTTTAPRGSNQNKNKKKSDDLLQRVNDLLLLQQQQEAGTDTATFESVRAALLEELSLRYQLQRHKNRQLRAMLLLMAHRGRQQHQQQQQSNGGAATRILDRTMEASADSRKHLEDILQELKHIVTTRFALPLSALQQHHRDHKKKHTHSNRRVSIAPSVEEEGAGASTITSSSPFSSTAPPNKSVVTHDEVPSDDPATTVADAIGAQVETWAHDVSLITAALRHFKQQEQQQEQQQHNTAKSSVFEDLPSFASRTGTPSGTSVADQQHQQRRSSTNADTPTKLLSSSLTGRPSTSLLGDSLPSTPGTPHRRPPIDADAETTTPPLHVTVSSPLPFSAGAAATATGGAIAEPNNGNSNSSEKKKHRRNTELEPLAQSPSSSTTAATAAAEGGTGAAPSSAPKQQQQHRTSKSNAGRRRSSVTRRNSNGGGS